MKELYYKEKKYTKTYVNWEIFDILTGDKIYEIDNLYESKESKNAKSDNLLADMNIENND